MCEGETTLIRDLLGSFSKGMLVLADRNCYSFKLWTEASATGAELLWHTKSNHVLPVDERLGDGSWLSHLHEVVKNHLRPSDVVVRVVEFAVDDPGRHQAEDSTYRLVTTLLDPDAAPAYELAALYLERWEFETTLEELKTHQRGPRVVLRSKTPNGCVRRPTGTCTPTTPIGL